MARRSSLEAVLRKVRLEAGRASNPALNESEKDKLIHLVTRVQRTLYMESFWPFLTKREPIPMQAGQRFYDIPDGYDLDRIETLYYKDTDHYLRLPRGIDFCHYNEYDSFIDERSDPPMRWDIVDNDGAEQLEIWPIPQTNDYQLIIQGLRQLADPVADADLVEMDDNLVALFCAAELMASGKTEDARAKLAQGQKLLNLYKASAETASEPVVIGGGDRNAARRRPADIRYAPRS